MFQNNSATINDKHTFYDYGLYVTNTNPVSPPKPRTQSIIIPGRNGNLDITEDLTGYTIYENRTITLKMGGKKKAELWPSFMSTILNDIHGKMVKIVFDEEKDYYYIGRATVNSDYNRVGQIGTFTVTVDAEPYKYSTVDSMESWKWDSFSFVDGVIQSYSNLAVTGTLEFTISGSEMPVIPEFIASGEMSVEFEGKTYQLNAGKNKIYDIVIFNKEYQIKFTGNGTVAVSYRKGRL